MGSPDALQRRRERAVELLQEGNTLAAVARKVRADIRSVQRWKAAHRQMGAAGIMARQASGRPALLDTKEKEKLEVFLLKGAKHAGFPTDLWNCKRVVQLIRMKFGVGYHERHIPRILRSMGWTPQRPQKRAMEQNEAVVQDWIKHDWPQIKKKFAR